jgi:hypothetical protein
MQPLPNSLTPISAQKRENVSLSAPENPAVVTSPTPPISPTPIQTPSPIQPKKSHLILIIVSIVLVIIGLGLGYLYFLNINSSGIVASPVGPLKTIAPSIITAKIIEDLNDASSTTNDYVFKFYSASTSISDFIAIPVEDVGFDSKGDVAVVIYNQNSDNPAYIAQVITDPTVMHDSRDSTLPPFTGSSEISESVACFSSDKSTIVPCDTSSTLELDWSAYTDSDTEDEDSGTPLTSKQLKQYTDTTVAQTPVVTSAETVLIPTLHTAFDLLVNSQGITFGAVN